MGYKMIDYTMKNVAAILRISMKANQPWIIGICWDVKVNLI